MIKLFNNIVYYIEIKYYYFEVYFHKLLHVFGYEDDAECIPYGMYCYDVDVRKNKEKPINEFWIIPCKHYRQMDREKAACIFLGYVGWDCCLIDQCKMCCEKLDYDEVEVRRKKLKKILNKIKH